MAKCGCYECARARWVAIGYVVIFVVLGIVGTRLFVEDYSITFPATLYTFYFGGSMVLGAIWLGNLVYQRLRGRPAVFVGTAGGLGITGVVLGVAIGPFITPYILYKAGKTLTRNSCIFEPIREINPQNM